MGSHSRLDARLAGYLADCATGGAGAPAGRRSAACGVRSSERPSGSSGRRDTRHSASAASPRGRAPPPPSPAESPWRGTVRACGASIPGQQLALRRSGFAATWRVAARSRPADVCHVDETGRLCFGVGRRRRSERFARRDAARARAHVRPRHADARRPPLDSGGARRRHSEAMAVPAGPRRDGAHERHADW